MRRQAGAWILIPLVGLLAACSPPDEPVVALAVHDGEPIGVLVTCDGAFSQLGVFENDNRNDASARPLITWGVSGTPMSEVVEVPLFGQPPDGFEVDEIRDIPAEEAGMAVDVEPLTKLEPEVRYSLSGSSRHDGISVDFTVADFARIGRDEVLAPRGRETMKIMSREAFVRNARSICN
ncbi:hypothetical protein [Micromonospora sp. NBC_00858]|uniref:hypothetical protein n=1 Tax=Micromonospora sp. NBC_00858 TaxID=2975979 RepID=UPI00386C6C7A|nr:hypothetical protein OG990_14380 [Micromonospora sp. NBC_00858]